MKEEEKNIPMAQLMTDALFGPVFIVDNLHHSLVTYTN